MRYRCFEDWESAATFLRTEKGCDLCGIVAQSKSASVDSAPPPSGSAVWAAKAASPRAATAADAVTGDVRDTAGAAGASGSLSASREHGELSAVEQRTSGAVVEMPEERRQSSSTPPSSAEQPRRSSHEDQECGSRDRAVAASIAVRRRPFRRSTAFLVGHRNRLEEEALRVCDFLVHIEQVRDIWCCCSVHPRRGTFSRHLYGCGDNKAPFKCLHYYELEVHVVLPHVLVGGP